jgi:hypothetical protein
MHRSPQCKAAFVGAETIAAQEHASSSARYLVRAIFASLAASEGPIARRSSCDDIPTEL